MTVMRSIYVIHDIVDCPGCIGLRSSSVSTHGTMINDIIDRPGCIGVGIGVQHFGAIFILRAGMPMDCVIIVQYNLNS